MSTLLERLCSLDAYPSPGARAKGRGRRTESTIMKLPSTIQTWCEYTTGRMGIRAFTVAIALLFVCSCEEAEQDVFERRYALAKIPGFGVEDHVALLDHEDANVRYLAMANLLQMGALERRGEDEDEDEGLRDLLTKARGLLKVPAAKVRAIAAYAPFNRAGDGAEDGLLQ